MHLSSAHRSPVVLAVLAVLLQALAARPAAAVRRRLDLATMTARAGTIVAGRIVSVRPGSHPKYRHIGALYVTVKVSETIKGPSKDRLTFMQFAGRAASTQGSKSAFIAPTSPDLPSYRAGEEVLLFLYPTSGAGFTSPVGGPQGKFLIQRRQGQPATVNSGGGNQALAVSGELPPQITVGQQALLRHPGATMDYKTFTATVKELAKTIK